MVHALLHGTPRLGHFVLGHPSRAGALPCGGGLVRPSPGSEAGGQRSYTTPNTCGENVLTVGLVISGCGSGYRRPPFSVPLQQLACPGIGKTTEFFCLLWTLVGSIVCVDASNIAEILKGLASSLSFPSCKATFYPSNPNYVASRGHSLPAQLFRVPLHATLTTTTPRGAYGRACQTAW